LPVGEGGFFSSLPERIEAAKGSFLSVFRPFGPHPFPLLRLTSSAFFFSPFPRRARCFPLPFACLLVLPEPLPKRISFTPHRRATPVWALRISGTGGVFWSVSPSPRPPLFSSSPRAPASFLRLKEPLVVLLAFFVRGTGTSSFSEDAPFPPLFQVDRRPLSVVLVFP